MRAWEFITETENSRPAISLRQLHGLKHEVRARDASRTRRDRLVKIMYANPAKELERIDLEKARLELEQQQVELASTKVEAQAKTSKAISGMAKAGSNTDQQSRSKISNMAQTEMRRRKK